MIEWNDIDRRLVMMGKDRAWLAENTPYSWDSIRQALAPAGRARSQRMLEVLSRAIEDEERRQWEPRETAPGIFEIFRSAEEVDRADRASRIAEAPSLVEFCRDVIFAETDRLLAEDQGRLTDPPPDDPVEVLENHPDNQALIAENLADPPLKPYINPNPGSRRHRQEKP